ncbi:MAG: hypothetical protein LBE37_14670 [Sphingobacterium sp.]|jgi:DNA-binding NtrC family response regulator|nr:hypothetical protein [Sphingobacterium sp.]
MRQQKIKVLILENDIHQLTTTIEFVKRTAHLQLTSGLPSSREGLYRIFNNRIDLLIIDNNMPDIPLHEFLLQIQSLTQPKTKRRRLRVLVTSTQPLKKSMLDKLGISGQLTKPFDYDTFVLQIDNACESWQDKPLDPLPNTQLFLVRQSNGIQRVKINFYAIAYLQADGMDCKIWLSDSLYYTV